MYFQATSNLHILPKMPLATFLLNSLPDSFGHYALCILLLLLSFTFSLVIITYFYYFLPAAPRGMITRIPLSKRNFILFLIYFLFFNESCSFGWVIHSSHQNSRASTKPRKKTSPGLQSSCHRGVKYDRLLREVFPEY